MSEGKEGEEEVKHPIPHMEEKDLKELAMAICDGRVFHDRMIDKNQFQSMVGTVFMPIVLGGLSNYEDPENVGLVYEYYSEAGPRSCNGMPCFFSFRIVHRDDLEKLTEFIDKITYMRSEFMGDTEAKKKVSNKSFEKGILGEQDDKSE